MKKMISQILMFLICWVGQAQGADTVRFETDVRPILKVMCFHCHGEEEKPKGKLDLRLVRLMVDGGVSGAAVVPGKPNDSTLWERIESDEMPEGPKKLTAAQKAVIKTWIEQGAKTRRPEPKNVADAAYTTEELAHWAWQPLKQRHLDKTGSETIDTLLLDTLKAKGVPGFSKQADDRTLIRRLTYDLHGLPPTPDEVQAYLKDTSKVRTEQLLKRLLGSPRYGERWARHWLDVAGFAETDGNTGGKDHPRPHAWKYRDYVVNSLNTDKPYDEFIREQLAGDELAQHPWKPEDARTRELLTASGFLNLAPDVTEATNTLVDRNQAVADRVKVVASAVLGLTLGCAQCHDHKYDPVSQVDYYKFRAIFDPAFDLADWKQPSKRVFDMTIPGDRAKALTIEKQATQKKVELSIQETAWAREYLAKQLAAVPEADREMVVKANDTTEDKRTPEQKTLLEKHRTVKTIDFIVSNLEEIDRPKFQQLAKQKKEIEKFRATKPPTDLRMIPGEARTFKGTSAVHYRGDPEQPKQAVEPAELFVLARDRKDARIPSNTKDTPTTGRRLAYAKLLTDGQHPLVARVIVNRVWLHHFGKGLVNTPGDFGLNGEKPSHPELLDSLAARFMAEGWSLKELHTWIVTSKAYQQSAARTATLDRLDPENRLLGRMSIRRLEAEAVRDALLMVSGTLNDHLGGPSVPVTEDNSGRGVLGDRELSTFGKPYGELVKPSKEQEGRRSLYITAHRSMPLSMLETFDLPAMAPNCELRKCSTVPPQSLMFLNDDVVIQHADDLTERLWKEADDTPARLKRVHELLFAAEITEDEQTICEAFLKRQAEYFRINGDKKWLETVKKRPHAPDMRAMEALVQTLLSTNRFLYVD